MIELSYRHHHFWATPPGDAVERWHISADVDDSEYEGPDKHVGYFEIISVDLYGTDDPIGLLDGEEGDLGVIAATVFDPDSGELDEEFDEFLEPMGNRLLIINRAELVPAWRGFGLGAVLIGAILQKFTDGARGAVCFPAPFGGFDMEELARKRAVKALQRVWGQLGFVPFKDGVYALDLHTVALDEAMELLRERAESLWPDEHGRP